MRILFALPGLHRVMRGAETAFEQLAKHIALLPDQQVTLMGAGQPQPNLPYHFHHVPCVPREKFERLPSVPYLRGHFVYEELTFIPGLAAAYRPEDYDITVTCSYPYVNWLLRAKRGANDYPRHVFVTQNGDWMCQSNDWEYRHFFCDGLVCTNPEYFEQNRDRYRTTLIPNGVDPTLFLPGHGDRKTFNLPESAPIVLMVSALSSSKRVIEGIQAVAKLRDVHLVIAGDGELREQVQAIGQDLLGDRFRLLKLPRVQMPSLYQCADVFLHMSQDEPSSNAYIEALATGLPIVTHDRRVTRWTLEDCATLVDTSDAIAVGMGISAALSQKTDQDIARRRALVERRFSWSHLAEQYCAFFNEVSQQKSSLRDIALSSRISGAKVRQLTEIQRK